LMGRLGRDPEFLKQVKGSVSDFIYSKAEKHLITLEAQNNYILRYNLTRNFGELLPHYLQEAHYDIIKSNIDRLVLKEGFAQNAVDDFGKFDYMNLSDIFEYMDKEQFASMAKKLIEGTEKGGKIAYWNLMVPRRISTIFPTETKYMQEISEKLTSADKGFFYKQFIVDKIEA
jgi:S-adenosylmethionine-diacylglycerol 3-amino-3-carboxypropyl transferase